MVRYFIKLTLIFICILFFSGQRTTDIQSKRTELLQLKKEIELLDKKLKDTQKREKQNLSLIDEYDKQLKLLRTLIKTLEDEEKRLSEEVKKKENELKIAEDELDELKNEYEKHIVNLYKFGRKNYLELLLTSQSVNQAIIRYKYLERFTDDRKKRIELINNKAREVQLERENLIRILDEKEVVKKEKSQEENQLRQKLSHRREIVNSLRKDKDALLLDLERKKKSAKKIEELIVQLIERKKREEAEARQREMDRKRRLEEKKSISKSNDQILNQQKKGKQMTISEDYEKMFEMSSNFSSFSRMKGTLPWPVNGRIINRFGEQRNPRLNTITLNFGVDISTPYGSPVRAIADGKVSIVHWLPGYGNILIITHSEGFRTVFAYLSEILVNEGDIVRKGDVIAKSGESLNGEMVHLEIWKEREKQNPELWLAKK